MHPSKNFAKFLILFLLLIGAMVSLVCLDFLFCFKNALVIIDSSKTVVIDDLEVPKNTIFTLENVSDSDVQVVGIESGCSCVTTEDIPFTIQAHTKRDITIKVVGNPGQEGLARRDLRLFVDVPSTELILTVWIKPNY